MTDERNSDNTWRETAPGATLGRMALATAVAQRSWDARPLAAKVTVGSMSLLAGALLLGLLSPEATSTSGPALLVVAGVLGLPHGAVDHLALGWAAGRTGSASRAVITAYAGAAVAVAVAALAAPLPAVLVLLALSAAHFAEGEAAFDRLRGGAGLALPAAAHGLTVVAGPLLLHHGAVRPVLVALDRGLPGALDLVRVPVLATVSVVVLAGLATALRAGQRRTAIELALLVAAVVLAPPLLVFAVWFGGWHAPRHLVRLLALEPVGDGRERLRRLATGAVLPTAVALTGLVVVAVVTGGLPGAVLVVLLALTVPHAAVVARLSRVAPAAG